jgi:ADP-heptose:LPS heptosyltransferase
MSMSSVADQDPTSVGVVHLNQLGDLIFSLPVLTSLRERFPRSRLFSVVKEPLEPLLASSSLVDGVLVHRGSRDFFASLGRIRAVELDLAICLSQSPRSRLLAYASGAERRIGFAGGPLQSLLTESVEKVGLPSTANNLGLVRAMGWPTPHLEYRGLLKPTPEDRAAAGALLEAEGWVGGSRLIVISASASRGREEKEWPAERFLEVARRAARTGASTAFVGMSRPEGVRHAPDDGILDLSGKTDLRELMGVLACSTLFAGIDSGVLHLAAALGKPCVALFGPTDPRETGPQGMGHAVIRASETGPGPMEAILVEQVAEAIEDLLERSG